MDDSGQRRSASRGGRESGRAPAADEATAVNREYYGRPPPGLIDYWRKMAAPRQRMATFRRLLSQEPPSRVVDLGCGNGQLLSEIAGIHTKSALTGIDLSERQIQSNREVMPEISWSVQDLERPERIPSDMAGRFDAVIASEVIEHLKDPEAFLKAALALATPGRGRLLLSTQSGSMWETERRVGHLRHFTAEEISAMMRGAGWEVEAAWNCGFPFHDLSKWWANRDPDATMSRYSDRAYGPREELVCYALRIAFRFNSNRRGAQLFAVGRRPGEGFGGVTRSSSGS
jgi:SAM-dependent methyltransferase